MSSAQDIAQGGTGQTTAPGARKALGLEIGVDVQPFDPGLQALADYNTDGFLVQTAEDTFTGREIEGTANEITVTNGNGVTSNPVISIPVNVTFTGKTITGGTFGSGSFQGTADLTGTFSGTLSGTFDGAVGNITPSTGVFTTLTVNTSATIPTLTLTNPLAITSGGTGANNAASARTNLGLGTIAVQNSNAVTITGGSITGITDLAIADGGTGSSTATGARTNLGLGTAAVENIGTSGATVPLLSASTNTFSGTVNANIFNASTRVSVDGVQILGTRKTGWSFDSGTAFRGAATAYTAPTISNPPTQAEVQAIANALQNASRTIKALKDDLIAHGIIG